MPNTLRELNRVICCVTCAVLQARSQPDDSIAAQNIWDNAWNVSIPSEEDEALDHARAHPNHIMVKSLDWGFTVNGV